MSVSHTLSPAPTHRHPVVVRLALGLGAVAVVAGAVALLAWLIAPAAVSAPVRNPFGMGIREAAPSATGLGGVILALQGSFFQSLRAAVTALKETGAAVWPLIAIGFAYGVFHAAGPGHGKAVIAAYLMSSERALAKGFAMSLAAALVQAGVAVALVGTVAAIFRATAATMGEVTNAVEIASFAAVAMLGIALVWRKAGKLAKLANSTAGQGHHAQDEHQDAAHGHDHARHHGQDCCGHAHLPTPEETARLSRWRDVAGVVLAAGLRPCAGAIVVLVFALSQGVFAAGIAATVAMAMGTALTTGLIAALAVFAKGLAVRVAGGSSRHGPLAVAGIELLAAAFVAVLGLSLLAGLWTGAGAS